MAAESRQSDPSLRDLLWDQPYRFNFFQAVRLMLRFGRSTEYAQQDDPQKALLRFRGAVSLAFPASDLVQIATEKRDKHPGPDPVVMTTRFFGLTGPHGPLPNHYTELILERASAHDTAFREFLDLFHNRLHELYYRAWEKPRFYLFIERGEEDPLSRSLGAVAGLGTKAQKQSSGIQADRLLFLSGLLGRRPVSEEVAQLLLKRYFGTIPIRLHQFAGQRLELDEHSRCVLGNRASGSELGVGCPLGRKVWDFQGQIKVEIGPLPQGQYNQFVPGGAREKELHNFLHFIFGRNLDPLVELTLEESQGYVGQLGKKGPGGYQLGLVGWLGSTKEAKLTRRAEA